MKKSLLIIAFLTVGFVFQADAQQKKTVQTTTVSKDAAFKSEIKNELVKQMKLSATVAEKIAQIEVKHHNAMKAIEKSQETDQQKFQNTINEQQKNIKELKAVLQDDLKVRNVILIYQEVKKNHEPVQS